MAPDTALDAFTHRVALTGHVTLDDLDRELGVLCADERVTVAESSIALDLSRCEFLELDATLRLLPLLARLKQLGNTLRLVLPALPPGDTARKNSLWSYLIRWRFFEALRRHVDDPENLLAPAAIDHLYDHSRYEQHRVRDPQNRLTLSFTHRLMAIHSLRPDPDLRPMDEVDAFLSEYRDWVFFRALTKSCGFDDDRAHEALAFIAEESVLNAVAHAQGTFAVLAMQLLEPRRPGDHPTLILAVADDGVGIPGVLRRASAEGHLRLPELPPADDDLLLLYTSFKFATDSLLVAASTQQETTTMPGRTGMGLFFLKDEAEKLGATLNIRSGQAAVVFEHGTVTKKNDALPYYPGTTLRLDIPVR